MNVILSIIIVNYNSKNVLKDCLNSLKDIAIQNFEVIVIDNASDEQVNELEMNFPEVCFIYNTRNTGFAAANNLGIAKSKGKYILLLNPDTLVNQNSFGPMISYLEKNSDVGVAGCKIYNKEGKIERSTHSFPNLIKEFLHANEGLKSFLSYDNKFMGFFAKTFALQSNASYWNYDSVKIVDHVTGACMMLKREVINKVGLLDEAFFLYNEEVEWSLRIRNTGYKSVFLPDSYITHLFGYSTGQKVQKQEVNKLLVERYRGMLYFFQKHYGILKLFLLKIIVFEGFGFRLLYSYLKYPFLQSARRNKLNTEIEYIKQIISLIWLKNYDWRSV